MLERTTDWHLPIFLPSWEGGLFDKVHRVRVYGDGAFDFSGSPSVHVTVKGFEPTFKFERTFGGVVDRYMLDWLFMKQARRSVECAFSCDDERAE
jgi:hypothetical protein